MSEASQTGGTHARGATIVDWNRQTGAADNVSVVVRSSLVQLMTPDEMRGRVNAVNALFIGTSNQLGEFEAGMVAYLMGAVQAGIFGGVCTILVALLWMRLFPALRNAQRFVE